MEVLSRERRGGGREGGGGRREGGGRGGREEGGKEEGRRQVGLYCAHHYSGEVSEVLHRANGEKRGIHGHSLYGTLQRNK